MDSECTIFCDIDGVLTYRLSTESSGQPYHLSRVKEFTTNLTMLCALLEPNLICCSSWRYGRTIAEINGMLNTILGIQSNQFQFTHKLRDRTLAEDYGARDGMIRRWVDSHRETCKYWLVIDDMWLEGIPWNHHVMPDTGEGFCLGRLSEAFDKIAKQGGY